MSNRVYRDRPEAQIGQPAVLNGQRINPNTGKPVTKSIKVDAWDGSSTFVFNGWTYTVVSTERSTWDEPEAPGIWSFWLGSRARK